jgi:nucleoside phosphorylase
MQKHSIDIAIMTVLTEEYEAVLNEMSDVKLYPGTEHKPNLFAWKTGTIPDLQNRGVPCFNVVFGITGIKGNVNSAIAILRTIDYFNPRYILLLGIAGGFPSNSLQKGDIVVSSVIWG